MSDHEPTAFSFQSTKRLIQMIHERPCLWDKKRIEYKDRLLRDHAWAEIFEELDPAYKTANATLRHEISVSITKKWYNIRDSYVKSMKPVYMGTRNRPYIHADLLGFLDDRYFKKIQKCKELMAKGDTHDDSVEDNDNDNEAWDNEVFVSIDEVQSDEPRNKRVKIDPEDSLKDEDNVKQDDDIVTVLTNLIRKEEDEDRAFFKSITPSVKKLSEDSKLTFRIEVLKLIKTLRMKEKNVMNFKSERISHEESGSE